MGKKKSPVIANFNAYLEERKKTDPKKLSEEAYEYAFIAWCVAAWPAVWVGVSAYSSWAIGFAFAAGLAPIVGILARQIVKRKFTAKTPEEQWRQNVYTGIRRYFEVADHSSLHRHIDPVALQLLEAGAYYWNQVRVKLSSLVWTGPDALPTYSNLRIEVLNAADHAMDELAYFAANCLGDPQKRPSDDIKAIWQDLVDLRLEGAFERATDMFNNSDSKYSHQSPHINAIFHPAKELAEKLRSLNDEVDRLSAEAATNMGPLARSSMGGARIDALLQNLNSLRVASDELDASTKTQQIDQR